MAELNQTKNFWLDICRSLAICLVLMSHGRHFLITHFPWVEGLRFGGFLGVEIFFVLSGFLIGGILLRKSNEEGSAVGWIPNFWMRRWLRTIPNYLLFVGINVLLLALGIRLAEWPNLGAYLFFLQNLAWPHPQFFGEAWSLATEEVFYLVIPLLMGIVMLAGAKRKQAVGWVALIVLFGSVMARFIYVSEVQPTWDEGVRKIVVFRLDALMIGVLSAWLGQDIVWRKRLAGLSPYLLPLLVFPISLSVISGQFLDHSTFARVWLFPITSLGCAGLIIVGLNLHAHTHGAITVSTIARLSYSAYLANLPVFAVIQYFGGSGDSLLSGLLRWTVFIGGTFLVSWLVYHFFERPILQYRDKAFAGKAVVTASHSVQLK